MKQNQNDSFDMKLSHMWLVEGIVAWSVVG
jgi:hypothetical protein